MSGRLRYIVSVRDVNALVNVNRAGGAHLRQLLLALRIDARAANRIPQALYGDSGYLPVRAGGLAYALTRTTDGKRSEPWHDIESVPMINLGFSYGKSDRELDPKVILDACFCPTPSSPGFVYRY
jgi:hypothetical protein